MSFNEFKSEQKVKKRQGVNRPLLGNWKGKEERNFEDWLQQTLG